MNYYFDNCVHCCRCVHACEEHGGGFLTGIRDLGPERNSDYVPCHHCTDHFSKTAPCKTVCYYDAIRIERW